MELTKRQAIFLMVLCLMASKVQRLPSLVATSLNRHGYLVFLVMGCIDIAMLMVCLAFKSLAKNSTTYGVLQSTAGSFVAKLFYVLFALYFLFNSLLPYEAVHDLFANILFDHLSWEAYSLIFIGAVFFIAGRGLKNLGRLSEIFFLVVIVSFFSLFALGLATTNLKESLPFCGLSTGELFANCFKYNLWFGDFLIIYMFVGKIKECDRKFNLYAVLSLVLCTLSFSFLYMVFYGIYGNLTGLQNSLISTISQFALLGLDIGRIDWFLVLFFQFCALISVCTYIYLTGIAIFEVIIDHKKFSKLSNIEQDKKRSSTLAIIFFCTLIVVYVLDIFVLKSNQNGVSIIAKITKFPSAFMILVLPFILLFFGLIYSKKRKNIDKRVVFGLKSTQFVKKTAKKSKPKQTAKKSEESL